MAAPFDRSYFFMKVLHLLIDGGRVPIACRSRAATVSVPFEWKDKNFSRLNGAVGRCA